VGGSLFVNKNMLTSLFGCAKSVGADFTCERNRLTSLEFSPSDVGGEFVCRWNQLSSLEFCPTTIGYGISFANNNFTDEFNSMFIGLSFEERNIFLKYQSYFDIWTPIFNTENMQGLIADIKDGLK
jgi:hypothetical protein